MQENGIILKPFLGKGVSNTEGWTETKKDAASLSNRATEERWKSVVLLSGMSGFESLSAQHPRGGQ
jgi:hypothetical protein